MPQSQRGDNAEKGPASGRLAERYEILELQVVEQVHAERVNREHVYRRLNPLGHAGRGVAVAVAAEDRDLPFGNELQRLGVQPRAQLGGVPRAELIAAAAVPEI